MGSDFRQALVQPFGYMPKLSY
ncbi:MAG: hypothetical protein JWQ42_4743, partial [Edaphobacter sp.]|nr:hypothetical protein [Edaphobacter sp.]